MNDIFVFRLLIVISAIVIVFALVAQYNKNSKAQAAASIPKPYQENFRHDDEKIKENFESPVPFAPAPLQKIEQPVRAAVVPPPAPPIKNLVHPDPSPFESLDTEMYRALEYDPAANKKPQANPYPKEKLTKDDLLPKDAANTLWAQVNPAGQGDLEGVNMLDAGWNFGIDTQGQTLRNPNLQLRSEFPNPRADVGPWQQSTIENDCSRRYFEIGEA